MKRKLFLTFGLCLLITGSIAGCQDKQPAGGNFSAATNTNETAVSSVPATATQGPKVLILEEEAKDIALQNAGVNESDVTGLRIRLETDDGAQIYEVDFYVGTTEYDIDVDAVSGAIRSMDSEIEDDFDPNAGVISQTISEQQAKDIALQKVPGAQESNLQIQLESDDGQQIYEGTIIYDRTKYEFEINALDGTILEWEQE